jgi:hypothetical protein
MWNTSNTKRLQSFCPRCGEEVAYFEQTAMFVTTEILMSCANCKVIGIGSDLTDAWVDAGGDPRHPDFWDTHAVLY